VRRRAEILHLAQWISALLVQQWREIVHGVSGYLRSIEEIFFSEYTKDKSVL
jgi:hypothetical protein